MPVSMVVRRYTSSKHTKYQLLSAHDAQGAEGNLPYDNTKKRSTLEKAVTVLEAIIDQPQSVGLPDLADRVGMSRQSLHRLLYQLSELDIVVKVPNRDRFAIGDRFSRIALSAISSANQGPPVRAIIQQLVASINETCNLGVLTGRDYVYIERVECDRLPRVYLETGSRLQPHVTSGGKAMLAYLPTETRDALVDTLEFKRFTEFSITDKKKFIAELDTIRQQGFACAWQEFSEGIVGIGVPILALDGMPMASLALHAPIQRIGLEDVAGYAMRLQKTAKRLAEVWD